MTLTKEPLCDARKCCSGSGVVFQSDKDVSALSLVQRRLVARVAKF